MRQILRRNYGWIAAALLVAVFIVMIKFFTPMYVVGSGSMEPTLPVGSRVITYDVPVDSLERRDVITFQNDGAIITHTYLGVNEDGSLITKGDANPTQDNFMTPVMPEDVIGKVFFSIEFLTLQFWLSLKGMLVGIALIACVVLVVNTRSKEGQTAVHGSTRDTARTEDPV